MTRVFKLKSEKDRDRQVRNITTWDESDWRSRAEDRLDSETHAGCLRGVACRGWGRRRWSRQVDLVTLQLPSSSASWGGAFRHSEVLEIVGIKSFLSSPVAFRLGGRGWAVLIWVPHGGDFAFTWVGEGLRTECFRWLYELQESWLLESREHDKRETTWRDDTYYGLTWEVGGRHGRTNWQCLHIRKSVLHLSFSLKSDALRHHCIEIEWEDINLKCFPSLMISDRVSHHI